jgi:ATP-dependent Zn protease
MNEDVGSQHEESPLPLPPSPEQSPAASQQPATEPNPAQPPPPETPPVVVDEQMIATAYHEAGHAVVALSLGRSVEKLTIVRNSLRLGSVQIGKGRNSRKQDYFEIEALILLAGVVSEARYTGEYNWDGAQQDLRAVRRLSLARVETIKKAERLERRLLDKTEHHLDQPGNWEAVKLVAAELIQSQSISGRAARHLYAEVIKRIESR